MSATLAVDVTVECPDWATLLPGAAAVAEETAIAAWRAAGADAADAELGILLTDDATVQRLNREHRGQDKPTNVLSFPMGDTISTAGMPRMLGDVVIAGGVVSREAAAQGKTVAAHVRHLVAHGVLHLIGYDHVSDRDADLMESLEAEILSGFALPDPYRYDEAAE